MSPESNNHREEQGKQDMDPRLIRRRALRDATRAYIGANAKNEKDIIVSEILRAKDIQTRLDMIGDEIAATVSYTLNARKKFANKFNGMRINDDKTFPLAESAQIINSMPPLARILQGEKMLEDLKKEIKSDMLLVMMAEEIDKNGEYAREIADDAILKKIDTEYGGIISGFRERIRNGTLLSGIETE